MSSYLNHFIDFNENQVARMTSNSHSPDVLHTRSFFVFIEIGANFKKTKSYIGIEIGWIKAYDHLDFISHAHSDDDDEIFCDELILIPLV